MNALFKRQANYTNKLIENIKSTSFIAFGIMANDNFDMINISKHIKTFENCSELQVELNKLAKYIYDGKRTIVFHEFRQFPYINHGKENVADSSGLAQNYTSSDIYLIKFIKRSVLYKNGKYLFFDVDFIIKNTMKTKLLNDCSINDMPINEILK